MCARIKLYFLVMLFIGLTSCVSQQRHEVWIKEFPADAWYFDSVTFEIAPVLSTDLPAAGALDYLRDRLHTNHLCHRDSVRFIIREPIMLFHVGPWSNPLIQHYEVQQRTIHDKALDDRHFFVFVAYIRGNWVDMDGIKFLGGIQYGPSSFAIFKDGAGSREPAVLLHEFGHLLGMVKDKTRENYDSSHQYHCVNAHCVMFWSTPHAKADFDFFCKRYIRRRVAERVAEDN